VSDTNPKVVEVAPRTKIVQKGKICRDELLKVNIDKEKK